MQGVILAHAHAPKRRLWNIRSIRHHRTPLRKQRTGLFIHSSGFGIFLDSPTLEQSGIARTIRGSQILHDVQPGKRIVRIKDGIRILAPQVILHVLASQRRPAANHRELELLPLQILNDILHLQRRLY